MIFSVALSIGPALFYGAFKLKMIVPQSDIPSFMLMLYPWIYCPFLWCVYNFVFQLVGTNDLAIILFPGVLLISFSPMIYVVYGLFVVRVLEPISDKEMDAFSYTAWGLEILLKLSGYGFVGVFFYKTWQKNNADPDWDNFVAWLKESMGVDSSYWAVMVLNALADYFVLDLTGSDALWIHVASVRKNELMFRFYEAELEEKNAVAENGLIRSTTRQATQKRILARAQTKEAGNSLEPGSAMRSAGGGRTVKFSPDVQGASSFSSDASDWDAQSGRGDGRQATLARQGTTMTDLPTTISEEDEGEDSCKALTADRAERLDSLVGGLFGELYDPGGDPLMNSGAGTGDSFSSFKYDAAGSGGSGGGGGEYSYNNQALHGYGVQGSEYGNQSMDMDPGRQTSRPFQPAALPASWTGAVSAQDQQAIQMGTLHHPGSRQPTQNFGYSPNSAPPTPPSLDHWGSQPQHQPQAAGWGRSATPQQHHNAGPTPWGGQHGRPNWGNLYYS